MAKLFDSPGMRETIRRVIRAHMAFKGFEYKDLCEALQELGVEQKESNLRSKVNNGSLGAQLFVYILLALGVKTLDLEQLQEVLQDVEVRLADDGEAGGEGVSAPAADNA